MTFAHAHIGFLQIKYFFIFLPFFRKMVKIMAENHLLKGDSWKVTCSEAYLLDRMAVQFEDMRNRDDEDFYANIANYAAMLSLKVKTTFHRGDG